MQNGLSETAYQKISNDVENGDINIAILKECDENELRVLCNEYNFTFIQKKAFIKAVKLIISDTASNENNNLHFMQEPGDEHASQSNRIVPTTPEDEKILDDMKTLKDKVNQFYAAQSNIKKSQ